MANLPPKNIPDGDVAHGLYDALRALSDDPALSDATRTEMERLAVIIKNRDALVNAKLIVLNQQVQALLAQFDWTKVRP